MNADASMVHFRPSRKHHEPIADCPQPETPIRAAGYFGPAALRTPKLEVDNALVAFRKILLTDDALQMQEIAGRAIACIHAMRGES